MGIITQEDRDLFDKHITLYNQLVKHQYVKNYTKEVYHELINLYTKYVNKEHTFRHWCSDCRAELVRCLYIWFHKQHDEIIPEPQVIEITQPKRRGRKPKSI